MLMDDTLIVKIADSDDEVLAAQHLRYTVFVTEMGAEVPAQDHQMQIEKDEFDPYFDHLILKDTSITDPRKNVVGVYRLMRGDTAANGIGFYGKDEYDLSKLTNTDRRVLELGRSCLHADYRGGIALHLMWNGLAQYVFDHKIDILFGVASFHGTDVSEMAHALSFLHHNHLAPMDLRVTSQPDNTVDMDIIPESEIDKLLALRQIPPLIKSYLRLGGCVGQGAYVDHSFNTIDVCLLMDTAQMSAKYKSLYEKGVI